MKDLFKVITVLVIMAFSFQFHVEAEEEYVVAVQTIPLDDSEFNERLDDKGTRMPPKQYLITVMVFIGSYIHVNL